MFTLQAGVPVPQEEVRRNGTAGGHPVRVGVVEDPIGGRCGRDQRGPPYRVLMGLPGLVLSDLSDLVLVPPLGVDRSLLGHDPKHVGQIVQGVDHLFHVGILEAGNRVRRRHGHGGDSLGTAYVTIVDAIDVIGPGKRVPVAGAAEYIEELTGK